MKDVESQKRQIMQMRQLNHQTIIKCEQMIKSSKALTDFVKVSEELRKNFSEKLRRCLSDNDLLSNKIFDLIQSKKLQ